MFDALKQLRQIGPMLAKAREMQDKMKDIQANIGRIRGTGTAGGGLVTATASGTGQIIDLRFSSAGLTGDRELLADLTRAAVNEALAKVQEQVQKEMQDAAGGLDLSAFKGLMGPG